MSLNQGASTRSPWIRTFLVSDGCLQDIHLALRCQGSRFSPDELLERATGEPLATRAFEAHLRGRYLD